MSEQVVIIGPGRMGLALGSALLQTRAAERLIYHGRAVEPPPHPLFEAHPEAVDYRIIPQPVPIGTTALVLAVPDDALAEAVHEIAAVAPAPPGCAAFHLAGALSTDVLGPLHAAGYAIGSLHPLQSVADAWSGGDRLLGSGFAAAGEPAAIATARRLVNALGGKIFIVPPKLRPLYHAAAVTASNYLVTLAATAARLLEQAGVDDVDAMCVLLPLMRGTLDNLSDLGVSAALTGPVVRGDIDTVRLHLARLSADERTLYCTLGLATLQLARATGLDETRAAELESLLGFG